MNEIFRTDSSDAERWRWGREHGFPVAWSQSHPPIDNPPVYWTTGVNTMEPQYDTAEAALDAAREGHST